MTRRLCGQINLGAKETLWPEAPLLTRGQNTSRFGDNDSCARDCRRICLSLDLNTDGNLDHGVDALAVLNMTKKTQIAAVAAIAKKMTIQIKQILLRDRAAQLA